ncbi:MAG TPA: type II secretion system protein [Thermoanaerobaculia bacterium]
MKNPAPVRGPRGFTLIELLVVMSLMLVLITLGIPSLMTAIHQAKVVGIAREMKTMMVLAQLQAKKSSAPAVVQIVPPAVPGDKSSVRLFVDADNNQRLNGTETVVASFFLPNGVAFEDSDGKLDKASVADLTTDPDGGPSLAIFQSDGTVSDLGAFRLADQDGNFLEVRVTSLAGKAEIRKWDGAAYVRQGGNGKAWTWN